MKLYWPVATMKSKYGNDNLFTYDAAMTLEKALQQFDTWENAYGFNIENPHVDVYEDGKKVGIYNRYKEYFPVN